MKWSEVQGRRVGGAATFGYTIPIIRSWRHNEGLAGRPNGLDEFYRQHSLCFVCHAEGLVLIGVDDEGINSWEVCKNCGGTGRVVDNGGSDEGQPE